jgi:hypothetical protein
VTEWLDWMAWLDGLTGWLDWMSSEFFYSWYLTGDTILSIYICMVDFSLSLRFWEVICMS